jgi:hypothetical protein
MSMRILLSLCFLAGCDRGPAPAAAERPAEPAAAPVAKAAKAKAQTFGAGVSLPDTVAIDAILAAPASYQGKTVRIEGTVTDVCPKRGCWFDLAGAKPGAKLRFKVTDGEMVFPIDSKGRHAVAQGQVAVRQLTLEESKQYASYQAEEMGTKFDPASVTAPIQIVRLDGTGAVFD